MGRCYSCGRAIEESEAYTRIRLGAETYLICSPTCLTEVESGDVLRRLMPRSFCDERVTVLCCYLPALRAGGDYASVRWIDRDRLAFAVADVSGHGITSSLLMSRLSGDIERHMVAGTDLPAMAEQLNRSVRSLMGEKFLYVTLAAAIADFTAGSIRLVNCGHPSQLLWSPVAGRLHSLGSDDFPIGLFGQEKFGKPSTQILRLHSGDKLLLFTDGLLDLKGEDGEPLGEAKVTELFHKLADCPTEERQQALVSRLSALQEAQASDDVLFVFADFKRV